MTNLCYFECLNQSQLMAEKVLLKWNVLVMTDDMRFKSLKWSFQVWLDQLTFKSHTLVIQYRIDHFYLRLGFGLYPLFLMNNLCLLVQLHPTNNVKNIQKHYIHLSLFVFIFFPTLINIGLCNKATSEW